VLRIDVPAGALTSNVTITLQPVTNTAPGGFQSTYRLGPAGQTFATPVTLTFTYPTDVAESADVASTTVASQQADGTWLPATTTRDQATGALRVSVTHFSDWTVISNLWIDPPFAAVDLGNTRAFTANICPRSLVVSQCVTNASGTGVSLAWSVNGVAGGNSALGTVTSSGTQATYRAPSTAPPNHRVTLGVRATPSSGGAAMLATAIVSVGAQKSWTGTVELTQTISLGGATTTVKSIANVSYRWNAGQDLYTPNGNVSIDYNMSNPAINPPCSTTMSGAGSVADADGELRIIQVAGQTYYHGFGGMTRTLMIRGTTTCNDSNTPLAVELNQIGFVWWPGTPVQSSPFGFQLRNNGTEMQEHIVGPNTTIRWLLRRDP
jgi:hypothetical protein